jgi:hypothetical protein
MELKEMIRGLERISSRHGYVLCDDEEDALYAALKYLREEVKRNEHISEAQ